MRARSRGANKYRLRQRALVIDVRKVIEDEEWGVGLFGFAIDTGVPYLVFQDPEPSEARKKSTRVNTLADWVNGVRIDRTKVYTIGPGSVIEVSDISRYKRAMTRAVECDDETYEAEVVFAQWSSSWRALEQLDLPEEETKNIFSAYAIARVREGNEKYPEFVDLDCFFPIGPNNSFNPESADEPQYPVIFTIKSLEELIAHANDEAKNLGRPFQNYLVRAIDKQSGAIMGMGEIISCVDYNAQDRPAGEVLAQNLAATLGGLSVDGLRGLFTEDADNVEIQVIGLFRVIPSLQDTNNQLSLTHRLAANRYYVPRDGEFDAEAPDHGANQAAFTAVPSAIRGMTDKFGRFWADKCIILGRIGAEDDKDSDIIPADAYAGTPLDENGVCAERGLPRKTDISYTMPDNTQVFVDSLWRLARAFDLQRVPFPNERFDRDIHERHWLDFFGTKKPPRTAGSGRRPQSQPQQSQQSGAAKAQPAKAQPAKPAQSAGAKTQAARTQPVKPGRTSGGAPREVFGGRGQAAQTQRQQEDDLGPAFPSEDPGYGVRDEDLGPAFPPDPGPDHDEIPF